MFALFLLYIRKINNLTLAHLMLITNSVSLLLQLSVVFKSHTWRFEGVSCTEVVFLRLILCSPFLCRVLVIIFFETIIHDSSKSERISFVFGSMLSQVAAWSFYNVRKLEANSQFQLSFEHYNVKAHHCTAVVPAMVFQGTNNTDPGNFCFFLKW